MAYLLEYSVTWVKTTKLKLKYLNFFFKRANILSLSVYTSHTHHTKKKERKEKQGNKVKRWHLEPLIMGTAQVCSTAAQTTTWGGQRSKTFMHV